MSYYEVDFKMERAATARIERMESALADFTAGRISRQKFYGTIRKETAFPQSLWESDEDYSHQNRVTSEADRIADAAKGLKTETPIAKAAKLLGMPERSLTVLDFVAGRISLEEATAAAERISHRHEKTDYDSLLASGVDRDTAREMIR